MAPIIDGGPDPEPPVASPDTESDTTNEPSIDSELAPEPEADLGADAVAEADADSAKAARLDRWLTLGLWTVGVALLALAAWFGWGYYSQIQAARLSSPALQVVDSVRKQVAAKPTDPVLHSRLAEALGAVGSFDEARQELLVAVKLDPKYVGAYQNLAQIEMLQKDFRNAEVHFLKVVELTASGDYENVNQRREEAFFYLGEIAIIQKRYEDAVGYLKSSIRIRKDASDSYLRLAQAYAALGVKDQALAQLDIALRFDPRFPEAHFERGRLYLAKGDKVQAAWDFRAALDVVPDAKEAKDALASLGTYDEWYGKAVAAFDSGKIGDAADAVRIARAIDPKSYDAAMLHGKILERQGKPSEAVAAYEIAVRIKPGDKTAGAAVKRSTEASETKGAK